MARHRGICVETGINESHRILRTLGKDGLGTPELTAAVDYAHGHPEKSLPRPVRIVANDLYSVSAANSVDEDFEMPTSNCLLEQVADHLGDNQFHLWDDRSKIRNLRKSTVS